MMQEEDTDDEIRRRSDDVRRQRIDVGAQRRAAVRRNAARVPFGRERGEYAA